MNRHHHDRPSTAPEGRSFRATVTGVPGRCAFPACDCPGETPACEDYEETADEAIEARFLKGTATEADYRMYVER